MAFGRQWPQKYARANVISGSVYKLEETAGAGADDSTVVRYLPAGTTTWRRFKPQVVNSADTSPPAVGSAPTNEGWREDVSVSPSESFTSDDNGSWPMVIRYKRSGQVGEIDQQAQITMVWYRVSSSGAFIAEVGRATSGFVTFTTATQTLNFALAGIGFITWNAGDKIQVEVYVRTFAAGVPSAPAVATDLILRNGEAAGTGTRIAPPTYRLNYVRTLADTASASDAVTRLWTGARTLSDSAPATEVVARVALFPRALADSAPSSDSLARQTVQSRAFADTATAADALTRQFVGSRALADSAPAMDVVTRGFIGSRSIADVAAASDAIARMVVFPRSLADSAPASEAIGRFWSGSRSMVETVDGSDALSRVFIQQRFLEDNIGPSGGVVIDHYVPVLSYHVAVDREAIVALAREGAASTATDAVASLANDPVASVATSVLVEVGED
jgi:hypothetical protein